MSAAWPHGPGCRVCASVAAPTVAATIEAFSGLYGADLVEVRLDALEASACTNESIDAIAAAAPLLVGFTVRPQWHGGGFAGDEAARRALLEHAAALDVAFVDVELEAEFAAEFVAAADCPVVLSHHWYEPGAADLQEQARRAAAMAPAVVKLVGTAAGADDAIAFLQVAESLVAGGQASACFCMGEAGRSSRLISAARGAALMYAATDSGAEVAPGQWTARRLADEFGVSGWKAGAELFGLLGDPIDHSLSPAIFNAAFRARDDSRAYVPLFGADLDAVLRLAAAAGVRGVSVTMPFKQEMARRSSEREALVETTGAANTVVMGEAGWQAFNTDGQAVVESLAEVAAVRGARVGIVGSGGAARAAAAALVGAGADVTILHRTAEHGREAAQLAGCAEAPIDALGDTEFDVVINATPVGMAATAADTSFPVEWLRGNEVVFDMVYRPRRTVLLHKAQAAGCTTIEGIEMFIRQATAQYRHLTGDPGEEPLALIRETVVAALGQDASVDQ